MNRYLFEYRYAGSEWGLEIIASNPEEAWERINALRWATYKGEVAAKIAVPQCIGRLFAYFWSVP